MKGHARNRSYEIPSYWRDLQEGEILKAPSGLLRVIRHIHKGPTPRTTWCFFAIQRCSWTTRSYTLYNIGELEQMGYKRTRKFIRFWDDFDMEFVENIKRADSDLRNQTLKCCDVKGIP